MPPAPTEAHCIGLSEDDFTTSPAYTDAVYPLLAVQAYNAAFESEGMRRRFMLQPTDSAEK